MTLVRALASLAEGEYVHSVPLEVSPYGIVKPSADTDVRLVLLSVTTPVPGVALPAVSGIGTPFNAICPKGARNVPSWMMLVALTISVPPADNGVADVAPGACAIVTVAAAGEAWEAWVPGKSLIAKVVAVVG